MSPVKPAVAPSAAMVTCTEEDVNSTVELAVAPSAAMATGTEKDVNSTVEPAVIPACTTARSGLRRRRKPKKLSSPRSKKLAKAEVHKILPPCNEKCKRKCAQKISQKQRCRLNNEFWKLNWYEQKVFILSSCRYLDVKRSTTEESRRGKTVNYFMKTETDSTPVAVCKVFFLSTLGFKPTNDCFVHQALKGVSSGSITPKSDGRGKTPAKNKIEREIIRTHIESFHPCISHYRREHAPNMRYLPSDISINSMYDDFKLRHGRTCSYDLYRMVVKEMRISFTKLGHEECEIYHLISMTEITKRKILMLHVKCVKNGNFILKRQMQADVNIKKIRMLRIQTCQCFLPTFKKL